MALGCSNPKPSTPAPITERSIQVKVTQVIKYHPSSSDFWRYVSPALLAMADSGKVDPVHVRSSLKPARQFGVGQYARRDSLQAQIIFDQIMDDYQARHAADPNGSTGRLKTIARGMQSALNAQGWN